MTDSQAALLALHSYDYTSIIVQSAMEELNSLAQQVKRIEVSWIKAHCGHKGNERAHDMARAAEDIPEIDLHIAESWTHYKELLRTQIYKRWEDRWRGEYRFRLTKMFYPEPSRIKAKQLMKESRTQTTIWIEIITGQNNLNYIQSKMKNISPNCRFCEEEDETFPHLLNECPCFQELRCDLLQLSLIHI